MGKAVVCIGCGDEVAAERAELGYEYCLKRECQAKHARGLTITQVGQNKSASMIIIGDAGEIEKRGANGELAKRDAGLGLHYRSALPSGERPTVRRRGPVARPTRAVRPWTEQQERIVRLYGEMGLSPYQIVERARQNTPNAGITEYLARQILGTLRRRR